MRKVSLKKWHQEINDYLGRNTFPFIKAEVFVEFIKFNTNFAAVRERFHP